MTASIKTLRSAIKVRLATIDGLYPYALQSGQERFPCAIVWPTGTERISASGSRRYSFTVEVWVGLSIKLDAAQDLLDAFLDPRSAKSIEAAIEGDNSLGGIADSVLVDGFQGYAFGKLNSADVNAIVARIPVEVLVS